MVLGSTICPIIKTFAIFIALQPETEIQVFGYLYLLAFRVVYGSFSLISDGFFMFSF